MWRTRTSALRSARRDCAVAACEAGGMTTLANRLFALVNVVGPFMAPVWITTTSKMAASYVRAALARMMLFAKCATKNGIVMRGRAVMAAGTSFILAPCLPAKIVSCGSIKNATTPKLKISISAMRLQQTMWPSRKKQQRRGGKATKRTRSGTVLHASLPLGPWLLHSQQRQLHQSQQRQLHQSQQRQLHQSRQLWRMKMYLHRFLARH